MGPDGRLLKAEEIDEVDLGTEKLPRRKRGRMTGGTRVESPTTFPAFAVLRNKRRAYVELGGFG